MAESKALETSGNDDRSLRSRVGISADALLDQVLARARKLPVRDRATLRAHYPDLSPDQVAERLISTAARASSGAGAAVGAWAVLPVVPAFPLELAAETVAAVAIEIKLVAELHEVYGLAVPGPAPRRMTAYTVAWGERRSAVLAPAGLVLTAGSRLQRKLSRRVAARAGRSAFSLAPLLAGAAFGALFNRRETLGLGRAVRASLLEEPGVNRTWD
ncbi:hypothetical protein ABIA35_002155 [Catenulispora sp. MAP12-49]|jgi:hypothetical protein|uniref:hypothetical protein n=1 Tax=unclassified Catenulispora TaxID=414885 RepID=UPI00351724F8